MYLDNHKKTITLVNSKMSPATLMNAIGHCTHGLYHSLDSQNLDLLDYTDAQGETLGHISTYPYIILKAKNSNQIHTALEKVKAVGFAYTAFTESMLGGSAQEQLEKTASIDTVDHEYICLTVFGDTEELQSVFKKFSLYR